MSKKRTELWLGLIVVGAGLLLAAIPGMWVFMSATAVSMHSNAAGVPSASTAVPPPQWTGAVERGRAVVRAGLTEQNLPALSVAVGLGREIIWAEAFGWANHEQKTPVAPDTKFRIGTASVPLTSAGVGVLLEEGQLTLDDEIQTYVPDYPRKPWPVTLRQLMGHVAGVRTDGGDEGPLFSVHCERPVDALPHFADDALRFAPGTEYRYSSYGWILVSAAVEAAAGEPFVTFIQKQVFDPLGMDDTTAESATDSIASRASFYFPRFSADPRYGPDPIRPLDYSCYAGASVFLSTPSDLVRFAMAVRGGKLLQPATVQLLHTSQRLPSGQETGYGLGWDLETVTVSGQPTTTIGHDGASLGGMVSSLMMFPNGLVVAVMSNESYAKTDEIALSIAQAFAEQGRTSAGK